MTAEHDEQTLWHFSLGLEELSLALSLINRAQDGRRLLLDSYPDLTEEAINERSISASHSLLAHGLCTLSEQGAPVLHPDFEQALYPLVDFEYRLVFNIENERQGQQAGAIYKGNSGRFTVHASWRGVVQILEHGPAEYLLPLLLEWIEPLSESSGASAHAPVAITALAFGELALRTRKNEQDAVAWLVQQGWEPTLAQWITHDLTHKKSSALLVKTTNDNPSEAAAPDETVTLFYLAAESRGWFFSFPSSDEKAVGSVQLVNARQFQEFLEEVLS